MKRHDDVREQVAALRCPTAKRRVLSITAGELMALVLKLAHMIHVSAEPIIITTQAAARAARTSISSCYLCGEELPPRGGHERRAPFS